MKAHFIQEPELEFGGGRHIDIRCGLTHYGPLDGASRDGRAINLGVIGDSDSVDGFQAWIARCRSGVEAKESRLNTLYRPFPGLGEGRPFPDVHAEEQGCRRIPRAQLETLVSPESRDEAVVRSVEHYASEAKDLTENTSVDVIVCVLPPELLRRIDITGKEQHGPRSRRRTPGQHPVVWHDLLKATAMNVRCPIQVTRPGTWGGKVQRYRQDGTATRELQDEATRAWNFFTALYYKAGGVPWRLVRDPSELTTCYVGVSFFYSADAQSVHTSIAEVFNERGEGVVVRGGPATISKEDRTPHLGREDAVALISKAIDLYRKEHKTTPARLVCHKSSYFTADEIAGVDAACQTFRIDHAELLSIRRSLTRFYRHASYPPLRGTAIELSDNECLLYTNGSIDFYRCYPGEFIPRPLHIRFDRVDRSRSFLASEILALTKMNWNTSQFVNSEPITLTGARHVGDILRHVEEGAPVQARYSYYM